MAVLDFEATSLALAAVLMFGGSALRRLLGEEMPC